MKPNEFNKNQRSDFIKSNNNKKRQFFRIVGSFSRVFRVGIFEEREFNGRVGGLWEGLMKSRYHIDNTL